MLYNACLREGLRRLDLMRESRTWRLARQLRDKAERTTAFKDIRKHHGFSDYALHAFAIQTKNACSIGDHLDTHVCQKVATRAFEAVAQHAYGARGRPRFRRNGQFLSIEGKSNAAGIRWRGGHIEWSGLKLKALFDRKDKHGIEAHALSCDVKFSRLVRKNVHGKTRWFAQIVLDGTPMHKAKNHIGPGEVGLDIGPSTVAAVSDSDAILEAFCAELEPIHDRTRTLQRGLDRSRRAVNPDNFSPDGTVMRGPKIWKVSKHYERLRARVTEANRKLAEARKRSHGRLANRVLAMGYTVKTEKLSYRSLQKQYGKSVSFRAPGMFVSVLDRKAKGVGGRVVEFPAHLHRLSQLCHCGTLTKKPLSQRWHKCACGVRPVQRDLYSAFLAKHVTDDGLTLDISQVHESWPGAQPLLERAMARVQYQAANGGFTPSSFGIRRQSRSPVKYGSRLAEAADAVGVERSNPRAAERRELLPLEPRL